MSKHYNVGKNNPRYGIHDNFLTGIKHSEKCKQNMRLAKLAEKNPMWKDDKVGNDALHKWVRRHLKVFKFCDICKLKSPYDLANVTGIYNRDFKNWKYLCRSCHMIFDYRNGTRKNNKPFLGRTHSEETKQKMRESNIGQKRSEQTKEKLREAWKKRRLKYN